MKSARARPRQPTALYATTAAAWRQALAGLGLRRFDTGEPGVAARSRVLNLALLAQATGSEAVVGNLRELVSRTAMLVALFEQGNASHCGCEEHRAILGQVEKGDVAGALGAMYSHLSLIETRLRPRGAPETVDAEAVLRKAWKARPKARASRASA